ncbi:MAG TPA: hypothetical protein PK838_01710 [Thermoleophilia bacterium]|mgnify:FL=1|nr:hypothetical protein [Thermoleophilia bacterium]
MYPRHDEIIAAVPAYERFLTLDEVEASTDRLLAAHPEVSVWTPGTSRGGHGLRCLELGRGPLRAALVGVPHPEEQVGSLVLDHLLRLLVETDLAERLGFRFSIIRAIDPDGMRLNECWFDEPLDVAGFLLRQYRPAANEQFEWTFPIEYKNYAFTKPLPEARAVMAVIDRAPLDFYMCLHNAHASGAYFYVTHDVPSLNDDLAAIVAAAGLPVHRGEPEMPYLNAFGDGVFEEFGLTDDYEYFARYGVEPAAALQGGTSSTSYAQAAWDCFTLVAEVPYFTSPKAGDSSPAGISRGEAVRRGIELEHEYASWLLARYVEAAAELSGESPWQRALYAYLLGVNDDLRAQTQMVAREACFAEEATVAQVFSSTFLRELDVLSRVGHLASMAAAGPRQNDVLAAVRAAAEDRVHTRVPQLLVAGAIAPVPLRTLVRAQLAALLCALDAVREHYRPTHPRPPAPRARAQSRAR